MRVDIKVVPHDKQRYRTVGDWWWEGDCLCVRVSELGDWRYELLVVVHEMCEAGACRYVGTSESEVTEFDVEFEKRRKNGNTDEPGDDPMAPYAQEHCVATGIERVLAVMLGVTWKDYEERVNSL